MISLKKVLPFLIVAPIVFAAYSFTKVKYYGQRIDKPAYQFKLKNTDNHEVSLDQFKGKFVLLTFGFTRCHGVCPINLNKFSHLSLALEPIFGNDLVFVFVSVDHIRDGATEMQNFVEKFNVKNLNGLISGSDTAIKVTKEYQEFVQMDESKFKEDPDYQFDHGGTVYLIDPKGNLALMYTRENSDELKILEDLKISKNKFKI